MLWCDCEMFVYFAVTPRMRRVSRNQTCLFLSAPLRVTPRMRHVSRNPTDINQLTDLVSLPSGRDFITKEYRDDIISFLKIICKRTVSRVKQSTIRWKTVFI